MFSERLAGEMDFHGNNRNLQNLLWVYRNWKMAVNK